MKQLILTLALAATLLAACGGESAKTESDSQIQDSALDSAVPMKEFKTFTVSDKLCFMIHDEEPFAPEFENYGVRERFSVEWPEEGMMTEKAMRELMNYYFGPEAPADIKKAVSRWRENVKNEYGGKMVKEVNEDLPYSYHELHSDCRQDGNLATFFITYGNYEIGAIHGMYAECYVTVDVETGEIVHLSDLLDTTRLGYAIARAIQDLDVNSETRDCLFDEYQNADEMPMTENFFIDSTRSTINVIYDLYHITPYCCGVQTITLPIFWLSKHLKLTPYAKQLFGPDSFIKE
jgi:hypothetical protein